MIKKLYYISTNGYDMIVSYDDNKCVRYLTQTEDFPYLADTEDGEKQKKAEAFLLAVEDDSTWETEEYVEDLSSWLNLDGHLGDASEILAEIEKNI